VSAWARARLDRERIRRAGYFDPAEVARLLDAHSEGRQDGAGRLWRILAVQIWHDALVDGRTEP
jgi:hypothetical protein